MINVIRKLRVHTFIVILVELLIFLLIIMTYVFDIFNLKSFFNLTNVLIISLGYIFFNIIYLWIQSSLIVRARLKDNFETVNLIGSDVKEAYNFGMLGLVVVDKDFNIVWASELFKERRLNILDKNILTWKPELIRLVELTQARDDNGEETIKIEIESRNYEVKFLTKAGIFLFKDTTEFEYLFEKSQAAAPVLGIIMIDNFSDIISTRDLTNPLAGLIVNEIYEYCQKFGILVRQYREDAFMLVLDKKTFNKIRTVDKFSLLTTLKEKTDNRDQKMTLSMGFAYNFPDFARLNELVTNAIETALARGGDQIVISKHGEETEYIGGAASSSERRNRTSIRLYADTLFRYIREAKNVLIMAHTDTDLDAIGASVGLKALADYVKTTQKNSKRVFQPARIVYSDNLTESKTRSAVHQLFTKAEINEIFITPEDLSSEKGQDSLINSQTLLLIADVSRPAMTLYPKLLERVDNVIIIDHHRRTDEFIDSRIYDYIETSASSTSEIVTELIHYGNTPGFKLGSKFSTLMLAGIYLDTNNFRSNTTGSRTFFASMMLEEWGADIMIADDFLKDEFEEYALITKIMASLQTLQVGVMLLKAGENDIVTPETLAKAANRSMRIKGVQAVLVIGYIAVNTVKVSARSEGSINVQYLLEKIGGGGHQSSAAAIIPDKNLDEAEIFIKETVELYINKAKVTPSK